jgi:hypothetical protein
VGKDLSHDPVGRLSEKEGAGGLGVLAEFSKAQVEQRVR